MQRFQRSVPILVLAIALDFAFAADAQAYLDPGTGSFIFQTLIAMVLGAAFTLKLYWQRVKGFFSRKPPVPGEASAETKEDESGAA